MFAFNFTKPGVCNIHIHILGLLSVEELSRSERPHVGKTSFFVVVQQLQVITDIS